MVQSKFVVHILTTIFNISAILPYLRPKTCVVSESRSANVDLRGLSVCCVRLGMRYEFNNLMFWAKPSIVYGRPMVGMTGLKRTYQVVVHQSGVLDNTFN